MRPHEPAKQSTRNHRMYGHAGVQTDFKVPLLSGRSEKWATKGEINYSEKDSLVEDLCGNSPKFGHFFVI